MTEHHTADELVARARNGIGHVTLNRPHALNALSTRMLATLGDQLEAWAVDSTIHAVVIRGAGEKAFSAGGDIKALYHAVKAGQPIHQEFFVTEYPVNLAIAEYPKPYVALLDGVTMGGGMGISQMASTRIVTDKARLGMPETGIGLIPDVGGTYFLPRLPGELGTYLALTGNSVTMSDALLCGLADTFLPAGNVAKLDDAFDSITWGSDPRADLRNAIRRATESPTFGSNLMAFRPVIDLHFGKNDVLSIIASLTSETRPNFQAWAQETVATLRQRSPTSLAITLEALRRGRQQRLADCLRMELNLVMNCFDMGDIMEGIRAVLVDKDHSPKWQHARIEDVPYPTVLKYFERTWPNGNPLAHLQSSRTA